MGLPSIDICIGVRPKEDERDLGMGIREAPYANAISDGVYLVRHRRGEAQRVQSYRPMQTHGHNNANPISLIVKKFFLYALSTLNIALYTQIMSKITAGYTFTVDLIYTGGKDAAC